MAASKLTNRDGFGSWGIAMLVGAAIFSLVIVLKKYHLPAALVILLLVLIIPLMLIVVYALVSGFASFFEEDPENVSSSGGPAPIPSSDATESVEAKMRKKLNWYERITLLIAVIATVATVAAAVEPIFHP